MTLNELQAYKKRFVEFILKLFIFMRLFRTK